MKRILVPVHTGFEETELITTLNILNRNKIEYFLWSIEGLETVNSSHEAIIETSSVFPTNKEFDGIFFHGGPAVNDMVNYDEIIHLAKTYFENGKIVSAICAAPLILNKAGILENKRYTAHHSTGIKNNTCNEIEVHENIITGRDYSITQLFAETLVMKIKNNL